MGIKVKKAAENTEKVLSEEDKELSKKAKELYEAHMAQKSKRLNDYLDSLVFYTDPIRGGSITSISSSTSSGTKYDPPTTVEGTVSPSPNPYSNLEAHRQKLRESAAVYKRGRYTFGSGPDEDEEYRLESLEQQLNPMEEKESYPVEAVAAAEINPNNIFEQYQKDKDFFPLFKFLIDINFINETSNIVMRDWRGHYPTVEAAREAYSGTIQGIITNVAEVIFHYYSYKLSSKDRTVIGELLTEIYISPTPKLFTVDTDTEEILSEIISLSKSRGIIIDKSFEIIKDIDFHEHRHNNMVVSIGYSSLFHRLFVIHPRCYSTARRPRVGSFYTLINGMTPVEEEPYYKEEEEMITINGEQYPRRLFEAIIEMDFDTFYSNIKIEYILSKDIADEGVAGTEELKLL